jgi:hypothetical protein
MAEVLTGSKSKRLLKQNNPWRTSGTRLSLGAVHELPEAIVFPR